MTINLKSIQFYAWIFMLTNRNQLKCQDDHIPQCKTSKVNHIHQVSELINHILFSKCIYENLQQIEVTQLIIHDDGGWIVLIFLTSFKGLLTILQQKFPWYLTRIIDFCLCVSFYPYLRLNIVIREASGSGVMFITRPGAIRNNLLYGGALSYCHNSVGSWGTQKMPEH